MTLYCPIDKQPDWRSELTRLEGAYAPSTMKSYRVNVEIFVAWCELRQRIAFPASEETLAKFLEEQAETCSISTIRQRFYAIRKFHRLLELEDATYTEEINLVLRRIRRSKISRPKQAKALNRDHRDRLLSAQPNTPWGLRDKAIIALGYDILARRSELVALKTSDVAFREMAQRALPSGGARPISSEVGVSPLRRTKQQPY